MSEQIIEYNLDYDDSLKEHIKVKFQIFDNKVIATFYGCEDLDTNIWHAYNPQAEFDLIDFIINKNHAKTKIIKINNDIQNNLRFSFDNKIYDSFFNELNENTKKKICMKYKEPLSEKYFKDKGVLLYNYNSLIKNIKQDNSIKKKFELKTYPISFYRQYIDKYFPKVNNDTFNLTIDINKSLDFNENFNETFEHINNDAELIKLSNNIEFFLNLEYCENNEEYINLVKKYNDFIKTILLYIFKINSKKTIQNVIDMLNKFTEIYNDNIYNDTTKNIINIYKKCGNNDYFIYFYKKTFGNNLYLVNNEKTYNDLIQLSNILTNIDGADNYLKSQNEFLKTKNKKDKLKIDEEKDKYKLLEQKYLDFKKKIKLIGIIFANIVGGITIIFTIFKKFRKKR